MIFVYRALAYFGVFLLKILKPFLPLKIKRGVDLRLHHQWKPMSGDVIWFHCASGEFEYAKPVIRELKLCYPQLKVVLTYFSPSVQKSIEEFEGVDQSGPMPWDIPCAWNLFFQTIKPSCLLIARTDLWPEMLYQTKIREIPRVLFSATVRTPAFILSRATKKYLMNMLSNIFVVSRSDQQSVELFGIVSSIVLGDSRFDQVTYRLSHPKSLDESKRPQMPALDAGSTWPGDEAILMPAVTELLKQQRLQLILVPHEPTPSHIQSLRAQCNTMGLSVRLYSDTQALLRTDHILLVDKIGILAELYLWGSLAYVGGSMDRKVHSVMEPLAAGLLTFVGPQIHGNREAQEFSELSVGAMNAVNVCKSQERLNHAVAQGLIMYERQPQLMREQIQNHVHARQGTSRKLVDIIYNQYIDRGRTSRRSPAGP